MWTKQIGRKKAHYVKEFNPTWEHDEKTYLKAAVKGNAKILVAELRTDSHHLRCQTRRWTIPKEEWEERICIFCIKGVVETERHFIFDCAVYEDIRIHFENILKEGSLNGLFEETRLHKTSFLVKIHNRRTRHRNALENGLLLCSMVP